MDLSDVILILVAATSVWVWMDAKRLGVRRGVPKGFLSMGPLAWFISCFLLWIVAFPAYLVKRPSYKAYSLQKKGSPK
jgi:hypothetical protein